MVSDAGKFKLPRVERVELENFSLYRQRRKVAVELTDGVFCLAGANGLGKSTFLSTLTYAITGIVPPPKVQFKSTAQYYQRSRSYARTYFEGRIDEKDRDVAVVRVRMTVGEATYELERNPFEVDLLRSLSILDAKGSETVQSSSELTDESRSDVYQARLVSDIGLSSFAQFVFLQSYLFTFDERRQPLFWDSENAEKVLYLALGLEPELAEKGDELRKIADGEDSHVRNAQYDATTARNRLQEIKKASQAAVATSPDSESVDTDAAALDSLISEREAIRERLQVLTGNVDEAHLQLASASAAEVQARAAYEQAFSGRIKSPVDPADHKIVKRLLQDHVCPLCDHVGADLANRLRKVLESHHCPLCGSGVELDSDSEADLGLQELKKADARLTEATEKLQVARQKALRIETECADVRSELALLDERLKAEERYNERLALATRSNNSGIEAIESQFKATIEDALTRKQEHLAKRDQALAELKPIRAKLLQAYGEAEVEFVPLFHSLATSFLGLPLEIDLNTVGSTRVQLILTVQGQQRRKGAQLSESQRYFLDIALRMALVRYMSSPDSLGCLYIDTPEGSLDIAYEARAGAMFAEFAALGHPLVMTANINTSQLLIRMAELCGPQRMRLVKMTEWTSLTDVQFAEEGRIQDAYSMIESSLRRTNTVTE